MGATSPTEAGGAVGGNERPQLWDQGMLQGGGGLPRGPPWDRGGRGRTRTFREGRSKVPGHRGEEPAGSFLVAEGHVEVEGGGDLLGTVHGPGTVPLSRRLSCPFHALFGKAPILGACCHSPLEDGAPHPSGRFPAL